MFHSAHISAESALKGEPKQDSAPSEEDDARHWNFRAMLGQGTFGEVSYNLSSPGMVLPFLYAAVGAPLAFSGLMLPIVRGARLVAGLVSAPLIGASQFRKRFLVVSLLASAAVLILVALATPRVSVGIAAMIFMVAAMLLGVAGGVFGVAYQDLLGRALAAHERRRLLYAQAALAGVLTIAGAIFSRRDVQDSTSLQRHIELLWMGIGATIVAGLIIMIIRERASEPEIPMQAPDRVDATEKSWRANLKHFKKSMQVPWFRRFLIVCALFLSIDLAMPFYAIHAASLHAHNHRSLAAFIIAASLGMIIGGILMPRIAKRSVRAVYIVSAIIACIAGVIAVYINMASHTPSAEAHAFVFVLLSMAELGSYNARSLYVVGETTDAERPYFVAVLSTVLGVLGVILALVLGVLAHIQGAVWPIWCLFALTVVAGLGARILSQPNPHDDGSNLGDAAASAS